MRPLVDVIRGKSVQYALDWLATYSAKKALPMQNDRISGGKCIDLRAIRPLLTLFIKEIRVDQGPMFRYYKPGAMGRINIYKKRFVTWKLR